MLGREVVEWLGREVVEYQTPRNKVLRGIKPRGTTFKNEYFCEFKKEFKNILGCEFGDCMGSIHRKTRGQKSHATVPLSKIFLVFRYQEDGSKKLKSCSSIISRMVHF